MKPIIRLKHQKIYNKITEAYLKIFERVGLGEKTFKTFASGLRFIPLVSDVMFTGTIPIQNTEMDTPKYFSCTGKIHYTGAQKYFEIPEKSSQRKTVKTDILQCSKSKVIAKIGQFANDHCGCSDELTVKNGSFPHFSGLSNLKFYICFPDNE